MRIQLQVLTMHLQTFLERVWEGNPQGFLLQLLVEQEQLRRQLEHRKIKTRCIAGLMQAVTAATATYVEEIRCRPTDITHRQYFRLRHHVTSVEALAVQVQAVVNELQVDLQMGEDVEVLARLLREWERKTQIEEDTRTLPQEQHTHHGPAGFRAAEGHFGLTENWYSTPQVRRLIPSGEATTCVCRGNCNFMCRCRLESEECPLSDTNCGNQRFRRHRDRVEVKATRDRGAGLFARERHRKGALVVEYRGEVLTRVMMEA